MKNLMDRVSVVSTVSLWDLFRFLGFLVFFSKIMRERERPRDTERHRERAFNVHEKGPWR